LAVNRQSTVACRWFLRRHRWVRWTTGGLARGTAGGMWALTRNGLIQAGSEAAPAKLPW